MKDKGGAGQQNLIERGFPYTTHTLQYFFPSDYPKVMNRSARASIIFSLSLPLTVVRIRVSLSPARAVHVFHKYKSGSKSLFKAALPLLKPGVQICVSLASRVIDCVGALTLSVAHTYIGGVCKLRSGSEDSPFFFSWIEAVVA